MVLYLSKLTPILRSIVKKKKSETTFLKILDSDCNIHQEYLSTNLSSMSEIFLTNLAGFPAHNSRVPTFDPGGTIAPAAINQNLLFLKVDLRLLNPIIRAFLPISQA